MLSPDHMQHPMPLATAAADYDVVRRAIGHIRGHWREQPEIETIAEAAGVTTTELHRLFRRARRHESALATGHLSRGQRPHGGNRHAYLRSLAMAGGTAAARRADRHRFRGAGLGGAVADSDGQARDLFGHRHQACQSHRFARGVGAAVGKNPVSFVVPCHRVVGKGGDLTGYHWGITRKRAMLGWEAGQVAAAP